MVGCVGREADPEALEPILDRWDVILESVENAGIDRIYKWLYELHPGTLAAYDQVQQYIEGEQCCPHAHSHAHSRDILTHASA